MQPLQDLVETVIEDYEIIASEIDRELSGDGWTGLPAILGEGGYAERLEEIRERIRVVMAQILRRLRDLRRRLDPEAGPGSHTKEILDEIADLQTMRAQLLALLDRLDASLELIEQKAAAATARGQAQPQGFLAGAYQTARRWLQSMRNAIIRVSGYLWDVVHRLLYLKEWKVKGSAGTGVLGLTSAELELTFGRDPAGASATAT